MKRGKLHRWLWLLHDHSLSPRKVKRVHDAMSRSPELKKMDQDIQKLGQLFAEQEMHFRPGFVQRTMNRLAQPETGIRFFEFQPYNMAPYRWMSLAGVVALVLLVVGYYFVFGGFSPDSLFNTETFSEENLISFLLYQ